MMTTSAGDHSPFRISLPPAPDLSDKLLAYQRQNLFCDVSLQFRRRQNVLDDQKFGVKTRNHGALATIPAHKVVLAAASPFFRRAIEEHSGNAIVIPEPLDEDSMNMILEWIYGGLTEAAVSGLCFYRYDDLQHAHCSK